MKHFIWTRSALVWSVCWWESSTACQGARETAICLIGIPLQAGGINHHGGPWPRAAEITSHPREGWGLQGLYLVCLGLFFFELFLLSVRVRKDQRVRMLGWWCNSLLSLNNILFTRLSRVCWEALGLWFWVLTLPLTCWVTLQVTCPLQASVYSCGKSLK